jgi:pyruvate,water dikinase
MRIARIGDVMLYTNRESWGGKGSSLLELSELLDNIPSGFVISTDFYKSFVSENNLQDIIPNSTINSEDGFERIKQSFMDADFSAEQKELINQEFTRLEKPVVARSSTPNEDGDENSFAGRYETVLGISTLEELLAGIKECYSSLHSPLATGYRLSRGINGLESTAVVIQSMVNAKVSGVAYSVSTMNPDKILVESAFGLGTSVVNGNGCDVFILSSRGDMQIYDRIIGDKTSLETFDLRARKMVRRNVPRELSDRQSLLDEQVLEIAKVSKELEKINGKPMDVEFAYDGSKLWVLQSRPITGLDFDGEGWVPDLKEDKILAESYCMSRKGAHSGPAIVVTDVDPMSSRFTVQGGELSELDKRYSNYILVTPQLNSEMERHLTNVKAIVATECGSTGHAAAVAREKKILYLGAAKSSNGSLLDKVKTGDQLGVAIGKEKGIVYGAEQFTCAAGLKFRQTVEKITDDWNFTEFAWDIYERAFRDERGKKRSFPHILGVGVFSLPDGRMVEEEGYIDLLDDTTRWRVEEKYGVDLSGVRLRGVKNFKCEGYRAMTPDGASLGDNVPCIGCPYSNGSPIPESITSKPVKSIPVVVTAK